MKFDEGRLFVAGRKKYDYSRYKLRWRCEKCKKTFRTYAGYSKHVFEDRYPESGHGMKFVQEEI